MNATRKESVKSGLVGTQDFPTCFYQTPLKFGTRVNFSRRYLVRIISSLVFGVSDLVYGVKIKAGNTPQLLPQSHVPQRVSLTLASFHKNVQFCYIHSAGGYFCYQQVAEKSEPTLTLLERCVFKIYPFNVLCPQLIITPVISCRSC